jgi:uncharacterized membrane protein YkoI
MKTSKTIAITAAMLGVLGFGGLMRTVYARSPQAAVAIVPHHSKLIAEASDGDGEANDETEPPENHQYSQSPATSEPSDGDGGVKDDVEAQQEQAKLQPLAKITPLQAKKAAEATEGSKASDVQLENEDGNLVYTVTIKQKEIKVDAGNGKVLYAESDNQNDEKDAASRPKSSIQVPQTESGDRGREQGEMNDGAK